MKKNWREIREVTGVFGEVGHLSGSQAGADHHCETLVCQKVFTSYGDIAVRGRDHYYTFRIKT